MPHAVLAVFFAIRAVNDNNTFVTSSSGASTSSSTPAAGASHPELHCPICDYDLHGLPEPRCPECGFRFQWDDLLRQHAEYPNFFETARAHRVRAYLFTLIASAFPLRFWRKLRPTLPPRVRPLVLYALISIALGLIGALVIGAAPVVEFAQWNSAQRNLLLSAYAHPPDPDSAAAIAQLAKPFASVPQYVDWAYPSYTSPRFWKHALANARGEMFLPAIVIGWPIVTFLALMIFRVSLIRARISPAHVLRCTIYSGDIVAWLAPSLIVVIPILVTIDDFAVIWTGYLPIVLLVLLSARILLAYQLYLRIRRGLAMVITSQLIAALVFSKLALFLNGY
jgi:hypothetical protein